MGVYVKGMEMPKNCMGCRFHENGTIDEWEMFCEITHDRVGNFDDKKWNKEWKPKDCPLVELPPHGRLIDADAFIAKEEKVYCSDCYMRKNSKGKVVYDIGDAPCRACRRRDTLDDLDSVTTIIEAEPDCTTCPVKGKACKVFYRDKGDNSVCRELREAEGKDG